MKIKCIEIVTTFLSFIWKYSMSNDKLQRLKEPAWKEVWGLLIIYKILDVRNGVGN